MKHYTKFKLLLKELIEDYYSQVLAIEKGKILAFGIFSDSDISSFIFAYNTQDGIDANIERSRKYSEFNDLETDGDIWFLPEWTSGQKKELFDYDNNPTYDFLHKIMNLFYEENMDESFVKYKNTMFDLFCESLKELGEENSFKRVSSDFLLLVQEGNNGIYDTRVESLAKILSPVQMEQYLKANESF